MNAEKSVPSPQAILGGRADQSVNGRHTASLGNSASARHGMGERQIPARHRAGPWPGTKINATGFAAVMGLTTAYLYIFAPAVRDK